MFIINFQIENKINFYFCSSLEVVLDKIKQYYNYLLNNKLDFLSISFSNNTTLNDFNTTNIFINVIIL